MNKNYWSMTIKLTVPAELRGEPIVIDDIGNIWHYKGERIKVCNDDSELGGYPCVDIMHGIAILKEQGYING